MARSSFLLLTAAFALAAAPALAQSTPRYDAATFFETTSIFGASFAPDETDILISSDRSGIINIHRIDLKTGAEVQVTDSKSDGLRIIGYVPGSRRILYTADQGGNELNHIYARDEEGQTRDLTPGDKLKAGFAGWSQDGSRFYVSTNERDPRFFDLYVYDAKSYERRLLFQNDAAFALGPISRDGALLALVKTKNNADSDLFLAELGKPEQAPRCLTAHEGNIRHGAFTFTPDGRHLIYGTDDAGEFTEAWSYELATGERVPFFKAAWDVSFVGFSQSGRYRITGINADARTQIAIYDRQQKETVALPELPAGDIGGLSLSPSETKLAFYVNGDTAPSNLHVLDLKSKELKKLSESLNPAIKQGDLVEGQVIRYPSFDGLKIPAILYKPKDAGPGARSPALVWVHGGPGGQSRKGYRALIQYLVNQGLTILAVNNRGSSGYGKTFYHLDDRKHGEDDLQDCIWGRRYLEKQAWVDGGRVGIIGGSYGGYMVAAALAFTPEAFDVGIDIFGVTNWLRTLKSIPPWWASFRAYLYAELGDPDKDEERLRRVSPLFHADKIKRPLLVIQGANDPRVIKAESDDLVAAARKGGATVEYIVFDDEGHGFRKRKNRIVAARAYLAFLKKHLFRPGPRLMSLLPPAETAGLDSLVEEQMKTQELVGLAVGLIRDRRIVYLRALGHEDREGGVAASLETRFRWASISKSLTAIAALQLRDQGKLALDADVRGLVPEFPDKEAVITARQLLCHQGGIVHYTNGPLLPRMRRYEQKHPFKDVVLALDRFMDSPLVSRPGARFSYTTHGFILLSAAVQRAGGAAFAAQVQERIAGPLGMAGLRPDYQWEAIPHRAVGYRRRGGKIVPSTDTDVSWKLGGGGFISTVEDLARFAKGLLDGGLVSKESQGLMWTRQKTADGKAHNYGLGFSITGKGKNRLIGHSGGQEKTRTIMLFNPETGVGAVVMTNAEYGKPAPIARTLIKHAQKRGRGMRFH